MIKVDRITRKYGEQCAVDDVSFEISAGEIVGLLGHNGAGKTTIMKMITGYLEPTAGTVLVDGLDIADNRRKVQQRIGYLPENCPVYPEMTVIDYLLYIAALHGVDSSQQAAKVAAVLKRTGLEAKADQPIGNLSRGYRQRTGVAQAILHQPSILILDEPTNGLDPTQIQHMRALIADLAKSSTVIISTHILQEVQAVCDRVIILKDGRKALDARLEALQQGRRLLLSLSGSKDPMEHLQNVDGVAKVTPLAEPVAGGGVRLAVELRRDGDQQELAAEVARSLHDEGFRLFAMDFERRNLETVFSEISAQ